MEETSDPLVRNVFPALPVRQEVLSRVIRQAAKVLTRFEYVSLHAGVRIQASDRHGLERFRPPSR
jgi:hypothetical protein